MTLTGVVGKEEDNYGLEMKTYLNEEDINRTGGSVPTTRSILRSVWFDHHYSNIKCHGLNPVLKQSQAWRQLSQ